MDMEMEWNGTVRGDFPLRSYPVLYVCARDSSCQRLVWHRVMSAYGFRTDKARQDGARQEGWVGAGG